MSLWNPLSWGAQASVRIEPSMPRFEAKASAAGPIFAHHLVGRPVWTERDYRGLSLNGYGLNAIAFRGVKMIAAAAAAVEIMLMDRARKEVEQHPLLDLLKRPSPMLGRAQFFEALYAYLLLAGNSYVEQIGPDGRPPRELWTLRPDRTKVIAGASGMPAGYEYEFAGRRARWDVDALTGDSPVLHIREFNPLNDWYGMSRLEAAGYALDRHNAASAHNKALLDNGARPSGALVFEPVRGANDTMQSAPSNVIAAAEKELVERHSGPRNAGRPMVLGGNVRWEAMGMSMIDMDFGASKDDAAREILTALGVPHVLVVPGSATFNNVREAKLELYEDTVIPLVQMVIGALNTWLTPRFGDGLYLEADLDSVSALEPRRETKRKTQTELLAAGIIDDDESRDALQYGPRAAGTVRKVDASVLTALISTVQTVGLTPLVRYMKSCGLFDEGATEESILADAMALMEQDDTDAADAAFDTDLNQSEQQPTGSPDEQKP